MKRSRGHWYSLLFLSLLLVLSAYSLNAQTIEQPEQDLSSAKESSSQSEKSLHDTLTVLPPWEEELRSLENLLDSWARDSSEQEKERLEWQLIVDSLNLSLTSSAEDLAEAIESGLYYKNLANAYKMQLEASEAKTKKAEKKARVYKGIAIGGAATALVGWLIALL